MKFKVESVTTFSDSQPHLVGHCETIEMAKTAVQNFIKSIQEPWDNWEQKNPYEWANGFIHKIVISENK